MSVKKETSNNGVGIVKAPRKPPADEASVKSPAAVVEIGGYKGPEPTRFGDWEKNGRCIDF